MGTVCGETRSLLPASAVFGGLILLVVNVVTRLLPAANLPILGVDGADGYARLSRLALGAACDEDRVIDVMVETDVAQLARELAQNAPVLLLDEPFDALVPVLS